jgi:hypothetical protein
MAIKLAREPLGNKSMSRTKPKRKIKTLPRNSEAYLLLACLQELLRPTIIKVLVDPLLAALRQNSAMLTSPRRPSRTMRIFSSAE